MTQSYDSMGRPGRVTAWGDDFGFGKVYVDQAVYSPYGQLLQRRLGDPTDVGGTKGQAWQTWIYEEGTRRLSEFYFDKDTAGEFDGTNYGIAALLYKYDNSGNVRSIVDNPVHTSDKLDPETQCFHYDYLQRLTDAWAQAGASETCAAEPSSGVIGGPGAYGLSYEYDLVGNRKAETQWTPTGSVQKKYSYSGAGEAGPHELTGVSSTGGAATAFTYDKAGFTTGIDRGGQADVLNWTPTGRLETIKSDEGTAKFYDNADGQRILRADANGDLTAWVAGYELTYEKATNKVEATRYYKHGDGVVGVRNSLGDIQWLAGDHHGTNEWIVNGDTLMAKARRRDPFGNFRGAIPATWPDDRGFVGGIENDDVQLTTVGAREYDAVTGRFISADPIMDVTDPQQINGYAYANNSPVTMSDASGLKSVKKAPRPPNPGKKLKKSKSGNHQKGPKRRNDSAAAGRGRDGGDARRGPGSTELEPPRAPKGIPDRYDYNQQPRPGGPKGHPGGHGLQAVPGDAAFWGWSDVIWQMNHEMCKGGLAVACGLGGAAHEPPGGYGGCIGGSAAVVRSFSASLCAVYTRDDGMVLSGSQQWGWSNNTGLGVNLGGLMTTSTSAATMTGTGKGESIESGIGDFFGLGNSVVVADGSGDVTMNPYVSFGLGVSPVSSTFFDDTTLAVAFEEIDRWGIVDPDWFGTGGVPWN